jgi:hypothetical protein
MTNDPKMDVLFTCYDAVKSLDAEGKEWVISQLSNRLGITKSRDVSVKQTAPNERKLVDTEKPKDEAVDADDGFAEALSNANPQTEDKKVLFAAWFLFGRNGPPRDFKALQLSKRLAPTGHGVNNVSVCLGRLKILKPALVLQVGKSGTKKQSRKFYRITDAGIKAAKQMLEPPAES